MQSCSGRGFHLLGLSCCQGHSVRPTHTAYAPSCTSQESALAIMPHTRAAPNTGQPATHSRSSIGAAHMQHSQEHIPPISPASTHHPQTHAPSGGAWTRPYSQPAATLFCIHTQLCTPARPPETFKARRRSLEMWGSLGRRGRGDLSCAVSKLDSTGCVHIGK